MMVNKKAEVRSHVIKLIMALLGILVLIGVAVVLWNTFSADTDLEKAERTLDLIIEKSSALRNSNENEDSVIIFPPGRGWFFKSYVVAEQGHPAGQCVGDTGCLCLYGELDCEKWGEYTETGNWPQYIRYCQEEIFEGKGLCKGTDFEVRANPGFPVGLGELVDDKYYSAVENTGRFWNAQEELKLIKKDGVIEIEKIYEQ